MQNKYLLPAIAIITLLGIGVYLLLSNNTENEISPTPTPKTSITPSPETNQSPGPSPSQNQEIIVNMINTTYQPSEVTIDEGQTVTWENQDSYPHTVTIPDLNIDQEIAGGESFSNTFSQPGTYDYECTIHPGMEGQITVESNNSVNSNMDLNFDTESDTSIY